MSNTICLNKYQDHSLKILLKQFYTSVEKEQIHLEKDMQKRFKFFHKSRGQFLKILRNKKDIHAGDISTRLDIPCKEYESCELGESEITDSDFFKACGILNATNEASIFLEKIEEAFDPAKKEGRMKIAEALRSQFGVVFASPDKYERNQESMVINFDFKKRNE